MNIKNLTISMATVALLFSACGGGGGGGTPGDDTPIESAVSINNSVKSFKAVAGERKYVTMSIGKDVITKGEPNSLFSVVSVDDGATAVFDNKAGNGNNYGNLRFEADNPGSYKVVVNVKNSGGTSANETFTFEVVSKSDAQNTSHQAVLAISRANYTRDNSTGFNVKDGDTGLEWIDNDQDVGDIINRTYQGAKEQCTGGWRLPTMNELLDIVDYSKPYLEASMLPEIFHHKENYLWTEEKNGKSYFVGTQLGQALEDTSGQQLSYRCVKGDKYEANHIISVEAGTGATLDYTTGLKWSKAGSVEGKTGAEAYCGGRLQEDEGWRLPTINELRSIVENGSVPSSIVTMNTGAQHLQLVSSTVSNNTNEKDPDTNQPVGDMHYGLILYWDRSEPLVLRYFDEGENAKYSATCVKQF